MSIFRRFYRNAVNDPMNLLILMAAIMAGLSLSTMLYKASVLSEGFGDTVVWFASSMITLFSLHLIRHRDEVWSYVDRLKESWREDDPNNPAVH